MSIKDIEELQGWGILNDRNLTTSPIGYQSRLLESDIRNVHEQAQERSKSSWLNEKILGNAAPKAMELSHPTTTHHYGEQRECKQKNMRPGPEPRK